MENYVLDTNIVIYYLAGKLPASDLDFLDETVNRTANISVITKLELLGWKNASKEDLELLTFFIQDSQVFGLNEEVADTTVVIRRKYRIKLPDAIIAATALTYNHTLVTNNHTDFEKIKGLKIKSLNSSF